MRDPKAYEEKVKGAVLFQLVIPFVLKHERVSKDYVRRFALPENTESAKEDDSDDDDVRSSLPLS